MRANANAKAKAKAKAKGHAWRQRLLGQLQRAESRQAAPAKLNARSNDIPAH
jgi:hypothetical protein